MAKLRVQARNLALDSGLEGSASAVNHEAEEQGRHGLGLSRSPSPREPLCCVWGIYGASAGCPDKLRPRDP